MFTTTYRIKMPEQKAVEANPVNLNPDVAYPTHDNIYRNSSDETTQFLHDIDYRQIGTKEDEDAHAFHKTRNEQSIAEYEKLTADFADNPNMWARWLPKISYAPYLAGGGLQSAMNDFNQNVLAAASGGPTFSYESPDKSARMKVDESFNKMNTNDIQNPYLKIMAEAAVNPIIKSEAWGDLQRHVGDIAEKADELNDLLTGSWDLDDLNWSDAYWLMYEDGNPNQGPYPTPADVSKWDAIRFRGEIWLNNSLLMGRLSGPFAKPDKDSSIDEPVNSFSDFGWIDDLLRNDVIPAQEIPQFNPPTSNPSNPQLPIEHELNLRRSQAVEYILNSGTDFMSNMFDVILLCVKLNGLGAEEADGRNDFFRELFTSMNIDPPINNSIFMVRTASIEVPLMSTEIFPLQFLYQEVQKLKSVVKQERKVNLKIQLDEPLYFMGVFNYLSNNNNIIPDGSAPGKYPSGFTPFTTNRLITESVKSKRIRIDLIIKHQSLLFNEHIDAMRKNWRTQTDPYVIGHAGLLPEELPLWWFEDINFLGMSEGLTFNNESAETIEMNFPFLYKRCIKVDRQFRHGTAQTKQFHNQQTKDGSIRFIDETQLRGHFGKHSNQEWYYPVSSVM